MEFEKEALIGACMKALNTHVLKLAVDGFDALAVPSDQRLVSRAIGEHVGFALDHQAHAGMCHDAGFILAAVVVAHQQDS